MNKDALLGYCGLYCGNCVFYMNTAKGIGTDAGDGTLFYCEGCNSGNTTPWCTDCVIKSCGKEKKFRFCRLCGEYPCENLNQFVNDAQYPYHLDVHDNMERLSQIGLDAWCKEMDAKYTCDACGEKYSYFDAECPKCKR